ncbi:MAG: class I SAM-dependent methyltransferase, partial [Thermoanaerobaculia bacterium]
DVGCGPGTFLGHFTKGFSRGLGVELARAQVEYARKTYGSDRLRFEAHDVTAFDTEDRFDVIVSIEVIEHLAPKDTNAFLNRLRELLKPGGILILTTPNYRSFWPIIEWMISKKGPVDYLRQHINHFNTRRLTSELAAAGFDIIRQRTFFVVAPFLAAISRPLAEWFYAAERLLLPRLGSEIVVAARKPQRQS